MNVLEVKFIGDGDALEHIVDKQEGKDSSHFAPPVQVFSVNYKVAKYVFCVTTRCAEQQRVRSEDGDVEDPSWTTSQRGHTAWWGRKWTWRARLRPSSRNTQHGRWVRQRVIHLHIFYLTRFVPSVLFPEVPAWTGPRPLCLVLLNSQNSSFYMVTLQWHHFPRSSRRWGWNVPSGWILHFHLSESQTWTQHGSDW